MYDNEKIGNIVICSESNILLTDFKMWFLWKINTSKKVECIEIW